MAESSSRGSFDEFDLAWLLRSRPNAFGHHFWGDCVLVFAGSFRQIHEGTFLGFKVLNAVVDFSPIELVKASDQSFDEIELFILPKFAYKQLPNSKRPWDVSADENLVFLVEAVLPPQIDFFPGQIKRTSAFCDQSLDSGLSDNLGCGFQVHIVGKHHDLLNRSGKCLRNIGKIFLALFQRPIEQIIVLEIQDVENDEEY